MQKMIPYVTLFRTLTVLAVSLVLGCSENDPSGKQAISGTVALNSAPLETGMIEFVSQETPGATSGAVIQSGNYSISAKQGLLPGKYLVRIYSSRESQTGPPQPPGPTRARAPKELIPPEYNRKSTETVDVIADGKNEFDYDIKTK